MSDLIVIAAALGSAGATAVSSVLQYRCARRPTDSDTRPFLARLLTAPLWLASLVAAAAGLVLHAVALDHGALAVVQPLLISGVLLALPVSMLTEGRRLSFADGLSAALLVAGISIFLAAAHPGQGRMEFDADALAWVTAIGTAFVVGAAGAGVLWCKSHAAAVLAVAAGIGYGLTAGLLKQTLLLAGHGAGAVLGDWPVYVMVVLGAGSIALTQYAYRAAPLAGSMPAATFADPAASVLVGWLAFHEFLGHSPMALTGELLGVAVTVAATVRLARSAQAWERTSPELPTLEPPPARAAAPEGVQGPKLGPAHAPELDVTRGEELVGAAAGSK